MSRLTEATFNITMDKMYGAMTAMIDEFGILTPVVMGLDADSRVVMRAAFYTAQPGVDSPLCSDDDDMLMLEGEPADHLTTLALAMSLAGAVAGVAVGTAWVVVGDAAAADVRSMGIKVSDHPAREECLLVVGHYREHVLTRVLSGRIVPNERGVLGVEPWPEGTLKPRMYAGLVPVLEEIMSGSLHV